MQKVKGKNSKTAKSRELKAILFDVDDTLLDTRNANATMYQRLMCEFDYPKPSKKKILSLVGLTARAIMFELAGHPSSEEMDKLVKRGAVLAVGVIPLMKKNELSRAVRRLAKKVKLGIVTNRRPVTQAIIMERFGLDKQFSVVVTAERSNKDVPIPKTPYKLIEAESKPSSDGVKKAVAALGLKKSEVVFVGDHEYDQCAGEGAGVKTIIISPKNTKKAELNVLKQLEAMLA